MGCLGGSREESEEEGEVRGRLAVRRVAGQERSYYLALLRSLEPVLRQEALLGAVLGEGGETGKGRQVGEKGLGLVQQTLEPLEPTSTASMPRTRRLSGSSMASFSFSAGSLAAPGGEAGVSDSDDSGRDSGILSHRDSGILSPGSDVSHKDSVRYSTVRRSPSPLARGSVQTPRAPPLAPRAPRPPTQRCSSLERGAWGDTLSQSTLFPAPLQVEGEARDRRRQKRGRNMTQVTHLPDGAINRAIPVLPAGHLPLLPDPLHPTLPDQG